MTWSGFDSICTFAELYLPEFELDRLQGIQLKLKDIWNVFENQRQLIANLRAGLSIGNETFDWALNWSIRKTLFGTYLVAAYAHICIYYVLSTSKIGNVITRVIGSLNWETRKSLYLVPPLPIFGKWLLPLWYSRSWVILSNNPPAGLVARPSIHRHWTMIHSTILLLDCLNFLTPPMGISTITPLDVWHCVPLQLNHNSKRCNSTKGLQSYQFNPTQWYCRQ